MFGSILKAAVGVVVAPVALAVDIITIPASSCNPDPRVGTFDRTGKVLNSIGKNISDVID